MRNIVLSTNVKGQKMKKISIIALFSILSVPVFATESDLTSVVAVDSNVSVNAEMTEAVKQELKSKYKDELKQEIKQELKDESSLIKCSFNSGFDNRKISVKRIVVIHKENGGLVSASANDGHGLAVVSNVNVGVGGVVASVTVNRCSAVTKHVGLISAAGLTEEKVDELVAVLCVSIGLDEGVCLSSRSGNAHGNEHSNYHNESKHERKCLFHCYNPF